MINELTLDELRAYLPPRDEPPDFDAFWQETLAEARALPLDVTYEPVDYCLQTVEAFDVTHQTAEKLRFLTRLWDWPPGAASGSGNLP